MIRRAACLRDFKDFPARFSGESVRSKGGPVVLKLAQIWSVAADGKRIFVPIVPLLAEVDDAEFDSEDLDIPDFLRNRKKAKEHEREIETAFEKRHEELQATTERKQQAEEDDRQRQAWLNSEHYREAMHQLADDIQDAREATRQAYVRAQRDAQKTQAALEDARRKAVILDGDRHVYFTRDGHHLYGEDDREITDSATVAAAQRQQRARPDATRYEEFAERRETRNQAAVEERKLRETLTRIDEIDKRVKKGDLSPDELARVSREQQDIIGSLPSDARAEYERLHAVRQDAKTLSYRAADPAFAAAPDLNTDFQRAVASTATTPTHDSEQQVDRRPAYRAAPDF